MDKFRRYVRPLENGNEDTDQSDSGTPLKPPPVNQFRPPTSGIVLAKKYGRKITLPKKPLHTRDSTSLGMVYIFDGSGE